MPYFGAMTSTSPLREPIKKLITQGLTLPALSDTDRHALTELIDQTDRTSDQHLTELLVQARDVIAKYQPS